MRPILPDQPICSAIAFATAKPPYTDPYVRWCGRGELRGSSLSRCTDIAYGETAGAANGTMRPKIPHTISQSVVRRASIRSSSSIFSASISP